jgi:dTDP-4-amino-4,6-dideoxygalactose transaminase
MRTQKRDWVDLALFGGQPAFGEKLHVGRPNIPNRKRLLERIDSVLSRRWLSNNGPCLLEFEQLISERIGVRHCVATCNGTVGLQIAIRALGLTGEAIVPSFTFVATAHALQWLGVTPVFCDVDCRTHNIDPYQVQRLITPRTSGIIGVHLWGRPCAVETLADIAEQHHLALMFDAAHAFGCSHQGRMIGSFGSLEVFSFHATKFFNTFEGGAIVTQDDTLAAKARSLRDFGFAPNNDVIDVGTNGKMTEVCAAMGLTGLECLDDFIATNQANYRQYEAELADLPGVRFMSFEGGGDRVNYQYIVLEVDEAVTQISRDQMLDVLHAENVIARRYFYPGCHRMEPYRLRFPDAGQQLPVTELLARRVLVLPTGTAVSPDEVSGVCEIVRLALAHGGEVRERLLHSARPAAVRRASGT